MIILTVLAQYLLLGNQVQPILLYSCEGTQRAVALLMEQIVV
jgi:hypothetical protein